MKISISKFYHLYAPDFFSKNIRYIFTEKKNRYLIIWYLEFRYIFPVIYSLFWLQPCATWHIYNKILLSRVRSHFWKCWINPVVLRTTVFTHNLFPQENVNVHKSCKNQYDHLVMCCVHSNDQIIDFLYTKIMKIDEK